VVLWSVLVAPEGVVLWSVLLVLVPVFGVLELLPVPVPV
jgi:hypothetical protein